MSYKKKKIKKNFVNQLKRRIGLIWIVLFKKINKSFKIKKEVKMQRQAKNIMQWLRERSRIIRSNNLKINEWVDEYIDTCILNGKPVEILTQYCLSKDLEKRYEIQGKKFVPLQAEQDMFNKTIPMTIEMFKMNTVSVNWYITFNNSFLDRGRVGDEIVDEYIAMIESLSKNNELIFLN